jgi:hypothetical protein
VMARIGFRSLDGSSSLTSAGTQRPFKQIATTDENHRQQDIDLHPFLE